MGWGDALGGGIGAAIGGYFSGGTGAGIGAGVGSAIGSFGEQQMNNATAVSNANSANEYSRGNFTHRYQWTKQDLEAAGLNPMLAYIQGGGSPPTAAQAPVFSSDSSSYADTQLKFADADLRRNQSKTEGFRAAVTQNDAIKGNYALMDLAANIDAAMKVTGGASGVEALTKLKEPQVRAGLAELRAAFASASNDAQVYEALNSKAVQVALEVLGRVTGSGSAIAGAVDRYRARSQRGDIINLNKE